MEWGIIGLNVVYAVLGVALMYLAYQTFDLLHRKMDFETELKRGNTAVAIFLGALFIGIAIIISGALN
jgi:uncharacterized membrane protein YjfL (UPF0719 family)